MIDDRTSRARYFGGYRGMKVAVRKRIENITLRDRRTPREYERNVRDRCRAITTTSAQRDG